MVIIGFDDQGVLHMMAAVVQVAKMGTKVCIIGWTRKKDDMMVIPSTVTAAGKPLCSGKGSLYWRQGYTSCLVQYKIIISIYIMWLLLNVILDTTTTTF